MPDLFRLNQNRGKVVLCGAIVVRILLVFALGQQKNEDNPHGLSSGQAVRCSDITRVDFKNSTIHSGVRTFAFKNGSAASYDGPPEPGEDNPRPDWIAEIERDTIVHTVSNVSVRFLVINNSHVTGSGWRYYISGYQCLDGELHEVFHRDGLSLNMDRLDSQGIIVSLLVGVNPTTGQPIKRSWSYIWDRVRSKYVIGSPSPNR